MTSQSTHQLAHNGGRFQPGDPRAGRKPGVPNKATSEIKAAAQKYGHEALKTLVELMRVSADPKVKVLAAREILDRAYGKPAQMIQGDPEKPLNVNTRAVDEFTQRIGQLAERAKSA
jgi:IS5 family transposase